MAQLGETMGDSQVLRNQNYFISIEQNFGNTVSTKMKNLHKTMEKLAKAYNKRIFLLNLRKYKVFPKNRQIKNIFKIKQHIFEKLKNKFLLGIISQEIAETSKTITLLTKTSNNLHELIKSIIPEETYTDFASNLDKKFQSIFNNTKSKHIKKLEKLLEPLPVSENIIDLSEKWLVNLTTTVIPTNITNVLKLGDKFALPIEATEIPYNTIITDIESILKTSKLDDEELHEYRGKFVNVLNNYKNKSRAKSLLSPQEKTILKDVKTTKKFLKENPDLMVTKADKGNATVIITRDQYQERMDDLLKDRKIYKNINKVSINVTKNKLNKLMSNWETINLISTEQGKFLKNQNGVIPRIYGAPKTHKENNPLRPIIDSSDAPLYNLSSFLGKIIDSATRDSDYRIKNSYEFKNFIKNITLPENYILISLDVVSLFTNIDPKLVYKIITDEWENIKTKSNTTLNINNIIEGLKLIFENTEFAYNGKYYKQIFGAPMGLPGSPDIANMVIEHIITQSLNKLQTKPIFLKSYVDDIITAVHKDSVQHILKTFNDTNKNIQFTIEEEHENKIPFLDLLLIRGPNGKIATDWFHKKTWSGRYLDYNSWLPMTYKKNTVGILTQKILTLSDPDFHQKNFKILQQTLISNNYPIKLIKQIINSKIQTQNDQQINSTTTTNIQQKYVSVPYIKNLFENISSLSKKLNIKTVGRAQKNLTRTIFTKKKDVTPKELKSNIIYRAKCPSPCNRNYIGQTKQSLHKRVYQHIYDKTSKSKTKSALSKHLLEENHTITIDDFQIIKKEKNYQKRSIAEMIEIKKCENPLNQQTDTSYLSNRYDHIIKKSKY